MSNKLFALLCFICESWKFYAQVRNLMHKSEISKADSLGTVKTQKCQLGPHLDPESIRLHCCDCLIKCSAV